MNIQKFQKLKEQWLMEEKAVFQGWDFSRLEGRWQSDEIKWDYAQIVHEYLKPWHRLLDMGTGGGEFLLTLNHPYPLTYVTEAYPPNVALCQKKLSPLGIGVKQVFEDNLLPFEDGYFDIVINRHEDFDAGEVHRVLKPGGLFITQQVGGENSRALSVDLIPGFVPPFPNHTLANHAAAVAAQGMEVMAQAEDFPYTRFFDMGAVVYFAKAIEWEFPGFSVLSCFDRLCALQTRLEEQGFIENREHRFLIVARKGRDH